MLKYYKMAIEFKELKAIKYLEDYYKSINYEEKL